MRHRIAPAVRIAMIAGIVGLAGAIVPAQAGDTSDSGGDASGSAGSAAADAVSKTELENFVAAHSQVRQIRAEYRRKLQQAEQNEERERLREEGQQAMVAAIRGQDLDIERYKQIGLALQQDKELQSDYRKLMREEAPEPREQGEQGQSGQY